jgi:hypothetical protein
MASLASTPLTPAQQRHPHVTPATEPHYSPEQVAQLWQLDPKSIRRIFRDEDGVLCFGRAVSTRTKRAYTTLRIPQSVLERVHRRMLIAA